MPTEEQTCGPETNRREFRRLSKRGSLGKVSILGTDIDLSTLNLNELLGKENESFNVKAQIVSNGYSIATKALIDTGANGFAFIDTRFALLVGKHFGLKSIRLKKQCTVRGYDDKNSTPITHALPVNLMIDGRRQLKIPMLAVNLGKHDIILGRQWLKKYGILPDCSRNRLLWPEDRTFPDEVTQKGTIVLPKRILERPKDTDKNREHQADMERRDRLMNLADEQGRYQPPRTQAADYRASMNKMERALYKPEKPTLERTEKRRLPEIDILAISKSAFERYAKEKTSEIFVTSVYDIEQVIQEKKHAITEAEEQEIRRTLPTEYHEFIDVFSKQASDTLPPRRDCDLKIEIEGASPETAIGHAPLYKQSIEQLEAAKEYIMENLKKGFIGPSKAPYASPILMARMPSGKLRFCVDFRKLNAITRKDLYPIPLIGELMERLEGSKIFTKIDIRQGFHRIRIAEGHEDLTTFRTRYGTFKYHVVPFGLTNGPATFQRYVNDKFLDCLDKFLTIYVDDLLIYSKNEKEHREHVKLVLQRLREAGLQASISKCEFHVTRTKYLGFIITTEGIEVDPDKVKIVRNWRIPTTVKGIQSFLGFSNFYRVFIQEYSRITRPLHHLTKTNVPFNWDEDCQKAFETIKDRLTNAPVLKHYKPELPTRIETDASNEVVAGILSQEHEGKWHPVAYYSKSMSPPEQNYEIHDKEMLAIIRALEEWRAELEGLQRSERFNIITDHRALEYFMTKKKLNARQARWAEFLSRFYFIIRYRPGKMNTLADVLSRPESMKETDREGHRIQILLKPESLDKQIQIPREPTTIAPIENEAITDRIQSANRTAPSLEEFRKRAREDDPNWELTDGILTFMKKLVVPDEGDLRARLLDEIHRQPSTAHPGREKTKRLLQDRYYWETWRYDTERYLDNCMICKRTKNPRDKTPGLLLPLPIPDRPWQHISMDFCSLPKDKKGYDAVFAIIDRLTKRPISIPCHKDIDAEGMAKLFVIHVYRWKGAPDTIVSDRGGQFISDFWKEVCKLLRTKLKLSTSNHPPTDGQTEIWNQYMQQRLRPFVNHYQDNWSELLPIIDFAGAVLVQTSTGLSPFRTDNGYEPRTSFDWHEASTPKDLNPKKEDAQKWIERLQQAWEVAKEGIERAQERQRKQANKHRRPEDFGTGDYVMVTTKHWNLRRPSRKLSEQLAGPFKILEKVGNSYKLDLPKSIKVHPVFAPEKLRKAATLEPLPGQLEDPQPAIEVNGQEEWEIESIIAVKLTKGKLYYKVKWIGYDEDYEWYPAGNFKNAPLKIQEFHDQNPERPGPPKRLREWLQANEKDEFIEEHEEDDRP
jgi:predicted aspartyl protease/transposase InsO family protein